MGPLITLYNVCAVPWGVFSTVGGYHEYRWGVFSTVGDIMINVGGYLEYHGGVQYCGGYHEYRGGYLEYRGVFSTVGDIMINVGDIMSTVEGVQYRGGKSQLLFEYPTVLNTPHGTHDIPHGTQISKDGIPPRY